MSDVRPLALMTADGPQRTGGDQTTTSERGRGSDNSRGVSDRSGTGALADSVVRGILGVYFLAAPLGSIVDRYGPRM